MRVKLCFASALTLLLAAFRVSAAIHPTEALTPKERAQGYSDRAILAQPRADQLATVEQAESDARVRVREKFPRLQGLRVIQLEARETVEQAVERLQATGLYEFVEPDYIMSYDATPNDPRFSTQWALNNTGQVANSTAGSDIRAPAAWDIRSRATDVIVAVIDTGLNVNHEDIRANLWQNPSPTIDDVNGIRIIRGARLGDVSDDVGHGSHVAGIIGAVGNNGIGVSGVAWEVKLMICKNGDASGSLTSDSAACVDYAVARGAKVINCSFGGTGFSQAFFNSLRAARDAGVIVVTSAGNAGANNDTTPHYPANFLLDNMISVGNMTANDAPSVSSDFGTTVELFAPGSSILSLSGADPTGYVTRSGTSMAAPHVTGAFALMRAQFPNDSYRQLINRVLRTADLKTNLTTLAQTGARLNLQAALASTTNRPFNDDFNGRAIITGRSFTLRSSNRDASSETNEPGHPNVNSTGSLWWQWIAPSTGGVSITTVGSDFDTSLAVYTGTTLGGLTLVAANDNAGTRTTSSVNFEATAGTPYRISVAGKNGATGYVQLNLGSAGANDSFANATVLSGESARVTSSMIAATMEAGEPRILDRGGNATLWFRWTAPRNGRFQASAFASDFDTLLAVYTGPSLNALTLIAANDDTSLGNVLNTDSRCTFEAIAGTTYHLQVDRKTPGETGDAIVTIVDSVWQYSADTTITSTPSVAADGTIYFGTLSPDRRLYALDPDGNAKWNFTLGGSADTCAPAIGSDGTIYVGTADGRLTALTPAGLQRWRREFGTGISASVTPAIGADGTIYIRTSGGQLHALNPADGSDKWRLDVGAGLTFASATVAPNGTVYQASNDQYLYAVNPDGTVKWRFELGSDTFGTPALDAAGNLYVTTSTSSRVISVTPDGVQRWSYSAGGAVAASAILSADGSTVYVASGSNRRLHAINAATGEVRWSYLLGGTVFGSTPAVDSDGVIYIGCADSRLYAINSNGTLKRTYDAAQAFNSSPAIAGGMLYVGSRDAKLYAFNLGAGAASGPWPQYAHSPRRTGRAIPAGIAFASMPQSRNAAAHERVTLSATNAATGTTTYQWYKDGVAIAGATASTLTLARASTADAGNYSVRMTHATGTITSAAAVLTVESSDPGRLVNLSILSSISSAGDNFTMGYVAGGTGTSGSKSVLVRVAGPALGPLGVSGFLEDPKLELFSGATRVAENDNWSGTSALVEAFAGTGAFPFPSGTSRDAALISDLSGSGSSVRVSAANNGTGTVLAELYDLTPAASFTATTPRLVNVSVLKHIGTGLTAGFVIGGSEAKRVMIRAIGGTLAAAPFSVPGTVADPIVTLFSGPLRIHQNDDWGGGAQLVSAFSRVGAFALPTTSRDSALLVTLIPGNYTVRVTGFGGATGMALVEVYEVP